MNANEIKGMVETFTKKVYKKYHNPHKICDYLEDAFAIKGIMCGVNLVPSTETDFGMLQITYMMVKEGKKTFVTETELKSPPCKTMPLYTFINNHFNPGGLYLLEKVQFQLEG